MIWLDAQFAPSIATWMTDPMGVGAKAVRELGLHQAPDRLIFSAAREADVIVMTKDIDFTHLLAQQGPPPRVLWITCGNTSKARMRQILQATLMDALALFGNGEALVEIADAATPPRPRPVD